MARSNSVHTIDFVPAYRPGLLWVIHDRRTQYPCRSMSVVTSIATLMFGAAK